MGKQLHIGKAGEYLVCSVLSMKGYSAFLAEQGLPYDVLLDTGKKFLKIQVKTTRKQRAVPQRMLKKDAYIFHTKRCGKSGKNNYKNFDFDILALVALNIMKVAFIKKSETKRCAYLKKKKFLSLCNIKRVLK